MFRHETSNYVLNIICFVRSSNFSTLTACRETSEIVLPICSSVCTKIFTQHKMDFQEICSCGIVIKFVITFSFLFKSNSKGKHFTWQPTKISAHNLTQNYFIIYRSEKCSKQKLLRKTKHTLYAQHSISTCCNSFQENETRTMPCTHYLTCIFKSKQQFSRHNKITSGSYLFIDSSHNTNPDMLCKNRTHLRAHSYQCFGLKSSVLCNAQ